MFKRLGSVTLVLAIIIQYGFITVNTVSCYSCEDKASIAQVKSCCAHVVESENDACSVEDRCCSTDSESRSFYLMNNESEEISFEFIDLIQSVSIYYLIDQDADDELHTGNINGPPLIRNGQTILKEICKYSL